MTTTIWTSCPTPTAAWNACGWGESVRETIEEAIRTYKKEEGKTKMAFIIAIAIYYGGIDVAVPTFLLWLVVWYGVLFGSGLADADDILGI